MLRRSDLSCRGSADASFLPVAVRLTFCVNCAFLFLNVNFNAPPPQRVRLVRWCLLSCHIKKMICASERRRLNMDVHIPSHSFPPPRVASLVNEPLLDRLKMEKKKKISGRDNIFFFLWMIPASPGFRLSGDLRIASHLLFILWCDGFRTRPAPAACFKRDSPRSRGRGN